MWLKFDEKNQVLPLKNWSKSTILKNVLFFQKSKLDAAKMYFFLKKSQKIPDFKFKLANKPLKITKQVDIKKKYVI